MSTNSVDCSTNITAVVGESGYDGSTATKFQCDICMKVLASQKNLEKHVNRVHAATSASDLGQVFSVFIP